MRRRLRTFGLTACLVVVLSPAAVLAQGEGNEAAVRDLGVEKGEPINAGFFFWEYGYVEAPYVVERRGVDVYVNGILVTPGPPYPPREFPVPDQDPGDPPPGSTPFDEVPRGREATHDYWGNKWRYLCTNCELQEAKRTMVAALRKCPIFREVRWIEGPGDTLDVDVVFDETHEFSSIQGGKMGITWQANWERFKTTRQEILVMVTQNKKRLEEGLGEDRMMVWGDGFEIGGFSSETVAKTIGILLSEDSREGKLAALARERWDGRLADDARRLVEEFRPTAELAERYARLKEAVDRPVKDPHEGLRQLGPGVYCNPNLPRKRGPRSTGIPAKERPASLDEPPPTRASAAFTRRRLVRLGWGALGAGALAAVLACIARRAASRRWERKGGGNTHVS